MYGCKIDLYSWCVLADLLQTKQPFFMKYFIFTLNKSTIRIRYSITRSFLRMPRLFDSTLHHPYTVSESIEC